MRDAIIDREGPIQALDALAQSGGRKMALLYGRRRVGKTFLLTNLWTDRTFYFTASATSPEINREVLISEAAGWSGEDLRPEDHPTWRTVFRSLLQLAPERHIVVVLDEVQYLAHDQKGLAEVASELNAAWEGRLDRSGGLLLVLSGSSVRTLEALKTGGSPLYGRLDWAHQIHPFDYFDAGRMMEGYGPIDRLRGYGAFGGVPKYLTFVDSSRSLEENIVELLLSPSGAVRLQLETVLGQEEGLREIARYQGILGTVGLKRRELGEIAASLGQPLGNARYMVNKLVDLGFLEVERMFDEAANQGHRYRIADPALRLFYGLVLPNESAIAASGAARVWEDRLAGQAFPAYLGQHVFEDVVRQAYRRFYEAKGLPAVDEWGRWAGKDRDRNDVEIDVIARLLDGRVLTGSAKMRNRPAGADALFQHLTDLRRLAESGRGWAKEALSEEAPILFASTGGFKDSFLKAAEDVGHPLILWTAEDLY